MNILPRNFRFCQTSMKYRLQFHRLDFRVKMSKMCVLEEEKALQQVLITPRKKPKFNKLFKR